ncbi:hypothetical protein ACVWWI_000485 [Bradyrhizobium sp. USDA 3686]|uniref:hypothetical protein n=1 Tax=Bradyrhizobium TaxID=374 RepID=UPI00195A0E3F|nr:hypothetical protein [Bradyrhizobium canariense]MBM7486399.1 hypothetical protein [Bradyrhizobium canariense]UFW72582.1 hypothetical protein BcanWU425_02080 [Bradyrhizobium canariense]
MLDKRDVGKPSPLFVQEKFRMAPEKSIIRRRRMFFPSTQHAWSLQSVDAYSTVERMDRQRRLRPLWSCARK